MRQASKRIPESAEKTVQDIRRATRRHHSAEEKIRILLEGLRGENSIAELCRKEGINQNLYARFSTHHGYIHHVAQFTMNGDANDQTPTERQQASQDHQARRQGTFRLRPSRQRRAAHSPRGF